MVLFFIYLMGTCTYINIDILSLYWIKRFAFESVSTSMKTYYMAGNFKLKLYLIFLWHEIFSKIFFYHHWLQIFVVHSCIMLSFCLRSWHLYWGLTSLIVCSALRYAFQILTKPSILRDISIMTGKLERQLFAPESWNSQSPLSTHFTIFHVYNWNYLWCSSPDSPLSL